MKKQKGWTNYIYSLYADGSREERPAIKKSMEGKTMTSKEIKEAMNKMRNGKATGNDNIAFELLNALDDFGIEKITEIANNVYNS